MKHTIIKFLSVLLIATCVPIGVVAQNLHSAHSRHHFGFGIGTNMFDSWKVANRYLEWTKLSADLNFTDGAGFYFHQSTAFSLHGEYHYDLTQKISMGARLQYHHRTIDYYFFAYSLGHTSLQLVENVQSHIMLPIFLSWRYAQWEQLGLFANIGGGVNYNMDNRPINKETFLSDETHFYNANFQLYKTKTITPIAYLAIGCDYTFSNGHSLATTLSVAFNQSRYAYHLHVGDGQGNTFPFTQNNIELCLTYNF